MGQILQQLVNGISLGAIYARIALGYTMVYGALRVTNFAHGDVFMLGAFAGLYTQRALGPLMTSLPWPVSAGLVLVISMVACAIAGIVIELLAYRPLRNKPRLNVLITAIGVSLFLEYSGQLVYGATQVPFPPLMPSHNVSGLGDLTVPTVQVLVLLTAVGL